MNLLPVKVARQNEPKSGSVFSVHSCSTSQFRPIIQQSSHPRIHLLGVLRDLTRFNANLHLMLREVAPNYAKLRLTKRNALVQRTSNGSVEARPAKRRHDGLPLFHRRWRSNGI